VTKGEARELVIEARNWEKSGGPPVICLLFRKLAGAIEDLVCEVDELSKTVDELKRGH
jgi:hypothetical protein